MTAAHLASRARQQAIEPILAILTVGLAAIWVLEPAVVFDGGGVLAAVESVVVPTVLLVPGLLALSVLVRVAQHGSRLASTVIGSQNRIQDGETALTHVGASIVLGALATSTLWWVIASVYVQYVADVGGVMLAPLVALLSGSVLGLLLVGREGLRWGRQSVSQNTG